MVAVQTAVYLVLASGLAADTGFGSPSAPFPPDSLTAVYDKAADFILGQTTNVPQGHCLVYGARQGRLAYALAERSAYRIIGAEPDEAALSSGQARLDVANLWGDRVTLQKSALDKIWIKECQYPYALIKAGDDLFVGGDGKVGAFDEHGNLVWDVQIQGKALGLAAARDSLFISTDRGSIICCKSKHK